MNGINELRTALDDHASALVDTDVQMRPAAVHRRVSGVRRRRRAAAGGVVAAAVVGGFLAWGQQPGSDRPEPTTVVGVDVPSTMTSLGFTYDLVDTRRGQGDRVTLDLPPSDKDRLISWATSGDDDAVTLSGDLVGAGWGTDAPDFSDFTLVGPGVEGTLTITAASGTPGIAVYEVSSHDRPAGYTHDGITFRQDIEGGHLLGAVVGDPGQSRVELPATADGPGVAVHTFCINGPGGQAADIEVSLGGDGSFSHGDSCQGPLPADGVSAGGSRVPTTPGEDVSLTVAVTSGGQELVDDDIVIVAAVYSLDGDPVAEPLAHGDRVEFDGRLWQRVSSEEAEGSIGITRAAPTGRREILAMLTMSSAAPIDVAIGDDVGQFRNSDGAATTQGLVSEGEEIRARTRGAGSTADFRISFYERIG